MNAELLKLRYLPLPRWTGALLAAVVVIVGLVLTVAEPSDPEKYLSIPDTTVGLATVLAALVFGVWSATLEFSAGTLQRTLIAEPSRGRVLLSKLTLVVAITTVVGLLVAAAAGGVTHLAAHRAGVTLDDSELAKRLFSEVPQWIAAVVVGFGFGLLARSLGGGIALSLVFVLAFDGIVSFIPGAADYTYGQLSVDLGNGLTGYGETVNSLGVAALGVAAWCALITIPGWIRFLRGDLK